MSFEKVTRLRLLLSEATKAEKPPDHVRTEEWRRAQSLEAAGAHALLASDASWRGITMRNITRIAAWYGWAHEIQRILDLKGKIHLSSLNDDDLSSLLNRLLQLEDCTQNGFGPPDAPPAT